MVDFDNLSTVPFVKHMTSFGKNMYMFEYIHNGLKLQRTYDIKKYGVYHCV